ncbi:MAG: hypothetical protein V3U24_00220 [Candidatus Neomarinimicrobiota bacterium]
MKINCWDFVKCGREMGGTKVDKLGNCPAFTYTAFHGTNNGFRAGRYCWYVAGTFQDRKPQCTKASKIEECSSCNFFQFVREEEGPDFQL